MIQDDTKEHEVELIDYLKQKGLIVGGTFLAAAVCRTLKIGYQVTSTRGNLLREGPSRPVTRFLIVSESKES